MVPVTREYTTEDKSLTVEWRAPLCIHCANCHYALPSVFDPDRRPWVDLTKASIAEVTKAVNNCPSGALAIKEQT